MQTCPICKSACVPYKFRVATAFGAEVRCPDCGSGLKRSNRSIGMLLFGLITAGVVAFGVMLAFSWESSIPLVGTGVVTLAASLVVPIAADRSDPITRHKITRAVLHDAGKDRP